MLTRKTLERINGRPRGRPRWPFAALGAVAVAAAAYPLVSPLAALAVLAAGAGGVLLLYRRERAARTVSLAYELDVGTGARFVAVGDACRSLAASEGLWQIEHREAARERGAGAGNRRDAGIGIAEPPGISANVEVWGLDLGEQTVYFFPEGILLYREDRYRAISYAAFAVSLSFARVAEETAPPDAEVVGNTWQHARPDGSRDRRYATNPPVPVVLYGVLRLSAPGGLDARLQVSSRAAAARFAQAFGTTVREGTGGGRPRRGASSRSGWRGRRPRGREAEKANPSSALLTLGIGKTASSNEITTAYRKLARIYHPDKVANLPVEVREFADLKMKEINAAYAELKRR